MAFFMKAYNAYHNNVPSPVIQMSNGLVLGMEVRALEWQSRDCSLFCLVRLATSLEILVNKHILQIEEEGERSSWYIFDVTKSSGDEQTDRSKLQQQLQRLLADPTYIAGFLGELEHYRTVRKKYGEDSPVYCNMQTILNTMDEAAAWRLLQICQQYVNPGGSLQEPFFLWKVGTPCATIYSWIQTQLARFGQ